MKQDIASAPGGWRIFFDNPLRRMLHPAVKILTPYISSGMTVLDFGCGFGHFAIGMARLTGETGRVIVVDVQRKMLDKTMARARKAGVDRIIQPVLCNGFNIGVSSKLDFALISNALHETIDPGDTVTELFGIIKPGGRFLLMEPSGHVNAEKFENELEIIRKAGFEEVSRPKVIREWCVVFRKPKTEIVE